MHQGFADVIVFPYFSRYGRRLNVLGTGTDYGQEFY